MKLKNAERIQLTPKAQEVVDRMVNHTYAIKARTKKKQNQKVEDQKKLAVEKLVMSGSLKGSIKGLDKLKEK